MDAPSTNGCKLRRIVAVTSSIVQQVPAERQETSTSIRPARAFLCDMLSSHRSNSGRGSIAGVGADPYLEEVLLPNVRDPSCDEICGGLPQARRLLQQQLVDVGHLHHVQTKGEEFCMDVTKRSEDGLWEAIGFCTAAAVADSCGGTATKWC